MAESEAINPEPEDFAAAEATVGPLPGQNGSPGKARVRYEVAQAHKLVSPLKGHGAAHPGMRSAAAWKEAAN